jgi:tRNA threonylcarbamoyl adenosine modification protein (Sua5/YciO/YrdC/YwlC family)
MIVAFMAAPYRRSVATIDAAADALLAGLAVIIPTDTVYGLAALPSIPGATDRLFALKGRPADVPLAVLVADVEQALAVAEDLPPVARRLADRWWPGPLTLVLRRRTGVALPLGGRDDTVGVRCPDHDLVRALAARVGPLATTSANAHGQPTPVTAAEANAAIGDGAAVVVDGGPCTGTASTVVDCTGERPVVVRAGPVAEADVLAVAAC